MKFIRSFFRITRFFWIISRLVLGLVFCYCAIFLLEGADTADYISAAFFGILGLSLLWSFIGELFRGGINKFLKTTTGIVLILIALVMAYSTINVFGMGEAAIFLLLPLWFFMAGLFEIIPVRKKNTFFNEAKVVEITVKS